MQGKAPQGFWVRRKGREKASGFGKGVGKVIGDKASCRSQRRATLNQLVPWQSSWSGEEGRLFRVRVVTRCPIPHPDSSTPQSLSPLSLALPLSGVPEFQLKSRSSSVSSCAPQNTAASSLPFVAGVPGAHLGAGAGLAHRPEQQERQAQQARGAGHGGALRTGS